MDYLIGIANVLEFLFCTGISRKKKTQHNWVLAQVSVINKYIENFFIFRDGQIKKIRILKVVS